MRSETRIKQQSSSSFNSLLTLRPNSLLCGPEDRLVPRSGGGAVEKWP